MKTNPLYKGSLNTIILKLLNEHGRMYGYEITQKVKALTNNQVQITEGALYPALHKMESDGILEVEIEKIDNRIRKYYKLTQKGVVETQSKLDELAAFIQNVQQLFNKDWQLS